MPPLGRRHSVLEPRASQDKGLRQRQSASYGEQIANMVRFIRMARRPDLRSDVHGVDHLQKQEIMSADALNELRSSLSRLSRSAALQAYHTAYARCRMVNDRVPSARSIQELVQVWKQLWNRR
jgi:hypothetical protein